MRLFKVFKQNSNKAIKHRFSFFLLPMFLILLADSSMAFSFPILVEEKLGSPLYLGLIMSFSSFVGICFDFFIPKLLKNDSWNTVMITGILISMLFPIVTFFGFSLPMPILFIVASAIWGLYFELISFSQQDFIINEEKKENFSHDWALVTLFWQIATLIGPIIAFHALEMNLQVFSILILIIQTCSLIATYELSKKIQNYEIKNYKSKVESTITFIKSLKSLSIVEKRVFIISANTFLIYLIQASFWTLGGILGEELSDNTFPAWALLIFFNMGMMISSLILTYTKISTSKFINSTRLILFSGTSLILTIYLKDQYFFYILAFSSSIFLGLAAPINETFYSVLSSRNKKFEIFLVSLNRMYTSLGYVMGAFIMGILSEITNYQLPFGLVGLFVVWSTLMILIANPHKIRLPHKELKSLEEKVLININ